ncbi:MAG: xanthine dehydrogenase family protein subunit M [Chloroflexi bacterium]|nr:xanthine dehydrogenase family protein subunit M [Chloroflexota bacterium]
MRRFEMALPESVADCVALLAERHGDAKLVAGGTDLVPQMKTGVTRPACVVDLSGIAELRRLELLDDGALRVGSAVSARAIEQALPVQTGFRALADGAALVGSIQVRNLATLGGNVCNAAPSADMAPPLLALDAEAVIAGPNGRRRIPLSQFFLGVRQTALAPEELLVEVVIPAPPAGSGGNYRRHTPRRELDIAVVGVASQVTVGDGRCTKARIALGAVAPTPFRATAAEAALEGQVVTPERIEEAVRLAVEAARPISDQRGSAEYRRHLVGVLTRRTLTTALERATGRATNGTTNGHARGNGAH